MKAKLWKPLYVKFNITPTTQKPFKIVHIYTISLKNKNFFTLVDLPLK